MHVDEGFAEALGATKGEREKIATLETTATTALIAVPLRVLFSPVHIARDSCFLYD
jgi:hypothetical protein